MNPEPSMSVKVAMGAATIAARGGRFTPKPRRG
jgi:hypothetical protein